MVGVRSGQIQLRFVWEVTARSLLTIKLHALERVLAQVTLRGAAVCGRSLQGGAAARPAPQMAGCQRLHSRAPTPPSQRREILAALHPVPPLAVRSWAEAPQPQAGATQEDQQHAAAASGNLFGQANIMASLGEPGGCRLGRAPAPWTWEGRGEHAAPAVYSHTAALLAFPPAPGAGPSWAVQPSRVAREVLERHAHNHNRRHLAVTVLEARGLNPRRGVVVALSASELPSPAVQLQLGGGHELFTTPVREHTLQPRRARCPPVLPPNGPVSGGARGGAALCGE